MCRFCFRVMLHWVQCKHPFSSSISDADFIILSRIFRTCPSELHLELRNEQFFNLTNKLTNLTATALEHFFHLGPKVTSRINSNSTQYSFFTSRKAGQHVLLVHNKKKTFVLLWIFRHLGLKASKNLPWPPSRTSLPPGSASLLGQPSFRTCLPPFRLSVVASWTNWDLSKTLKKSPWMQYWVLFHFCLGTPHAKALTIYGWSRKLLVLLFVVGFSSILPKAL